ncbi:alpha-ketoglutarate-dependent taurine dioxygenase [Stella humosa]|uniref:Alpha-ketoglutarate-dependent taurine dioxygenase n=2 Tax=Stella humosa TaxID=94 RepID=A0A3N1M6C8_9PROT|nr:TauD/TfdA family dioxygenase [Stella humosa]ROQ01392.1 alpha-ketoglutarate-dependent taurine dioxygenase [Stella humosa]BBK31767.1 dioxygenase [Stella humosa]
MSGGFDVTPLPNSPFGGLLRLRAPAGPDYTRALIAAAEAEPHAIPAALAEYEGLLLVPGLHGMAQDPALLVRLSRLFGEEVENYHETLTEPTKVHETVPEILVVSNMPPASKPPPPLPNPPRTADGGLPMQYPHRRGWHTDQSYRRPPPDISLFFAAIAVPKGQGQTLFANCAGAYEALPAATKARIAHLDGLHVMPGSGRSPDAIRAGKTPKPLAPHEQPQRQPLVRIHPVTGKPSLYLCEEGQLDWINGPVVGMEPGPDGEGGGLIRELMSHLTQPQFTYAQDWDDGDMIIWDNRCLVHAATWFDADRHQRLMWRTTVRGNPGPEYAGERRSWIPQREAEPA